MTVFYIPRSLRKRLPNQPVWWGRDLGQLNSHSYLAPHSYLEGLAPPSEHHCRILQNIDSLVMRPRLPAQSNRTVLSTPSIPENDNHEDLEHEGYRLTFVESQQNVWWLQGKNAAKHRHAIFTGMYPDSHLHGWINLTSCRCRTAVYEQ